MITMEPMKIMMEPMKIARQWVDFQKTAFDNTFDAMMMFQDLTEKMAISFLDYVPWLPEEGKKAINEWVSTYNKGCMDFKKAVDNNFDNVSMFFPEPKKVGKGKPEQFLIRALFDVLGEIKLTQTHLLKQMIDFNVTFFGNTFNTTVMVQDLTEKMAISFLDCVPCIPQEGKKVSTEG